MDEMLVKYLLGEASEGEAQRVQLWLGQSGNNRKHFEEFRLIWDESKKIQLTGTIDENTAWENFESFLQKQNSESHLPSKLISFSKRLYFKMAAAAILFITIGTLGYFYFYKPGTTLVASNKVQVETLPDNSVVTLNKNSTLFYDRSFNKRMREVKLKGEAFFNVAPDRQRPFEIEVNNIKVHVVGTSFNIKSNKSGTEIIVETGVVTVSVKGKSVKVLPLQRIFVTKNSDQLIVRANHDKLYNYYRTDEFICNNTPLYELVEALNKNYNVHIKIPDSSVAQLKLTTQFKKENLDDILKVISETLNVKVEQNKNDKIIINAE